METRNQTEHIVNHALRSYFSCGEDTARMHRQLLKMREIATNDPRARDVERTQYLAYEYDLSLNASALELPVEAIVSRIDSAVESMARSSYASATSNVNSYAAEPLESDFDAA